MKDGRSTYDVLRCDLVNVNVNVNGSDAVRSNPSSFGGENNDGGVGDDNDEVSSTRWKVWGVKVHLDRLSASYRDLVRLPSDNDDPLRSSASLSRREEEDEKDEKETMEGRATKLFLSVPRLPS